MTHNNVAVFIPHIGCPNMCSFCNQRSISGQQTAPTPSDVKKICEQAFSEISSENRNNTEIAFFGGSFTAIPQDYMISLLETAAEFVGDGKFSGIRISTRPDCIDTTILEILKKYSVKSIELGAQSMDNDVLVLNKRGHVAEDVEKASELIKKNGFELGLQIMTGLYGSTPEKEYMTLEKVIAIRPDTVRIYPVVILEGTELAELWKSEEYRPYQFDTAVEVCSEMLKRLYREKINVIRCGLHASDMVAGESVAGFYHPAFKELCESRIYRNLMTEAIEETPDRKEYTFLVNPSCISKALGHKKSNAGYFAEKGIKITVKPDKTIEKYSCRLKG